MLQAWGQRPNNHYHWKATKLDNLHGRCHDIHRSLHKYLELNSNSNCRFSLVKPKSQTQLFKLPQPQRASQLEPEFGTAQFCLFITFNDFCCFVVAIHKYFALTFTDLHPARAKKLKIMQTVLFGSTSTDSGSK